MRHRRSAICGEEREAYSFYGPRWGSLAGRLCRTKSYELANLIDLFRRLLVPNKQTSILDANLVVEPGFGSGIRTENESVLGEGRRQADGPDPKCPSYRLARLDLRQLKA